MVRDRMILRVFVVCAMTLVAYSICNAQDLNRRFNMQCRNGIASTGESVADLVKKCGEPTRVIAGTWIYDFGPNEFMYTIEVRTGKIRSMYSSNEKGTKKI